MTSTLLLFPSSLYSLNSVTFLILGHSIAGVLCPSFQNGIEKKEYNILPIIPPVRQHSSPDAEKDWIHYLYYKQKISLIGVLHKLIFYRRVLNVWHISPKWGDHWISVIIITNMHINWIKSFRFWYQLSLLTCTSLCRNPARNERLFPCSFYSACHQYVSHPYNGS